MASTRAARRVAGVRPGRRAGAPRGAGGRAKAGLAASAGAAVADMVASSRVAVAVSARRLVRVMAPSAAVAA